MDSLVVFWKSAGAVDGVEHADFVWEAGTILAARCHHEREPDQRLLQFSRLSWVSVGLQVAVTTSTSPKLHVAHEWGLPSCKKSWDG